MPPVSHARHQYPLTVIAHFVRIRLRIILGFRDVKELLMPRFLSAPAAVHSTFNLQRQFMSYRLSRAFRAKAAERSGAAAGAM